MDQWKNTAFVIAAVGQNLFILLYMTFPWYRTFLGRALFFNAITFGFLVNMAVASVAWDWPDQDQVMFTAYTVTALGIWAQLIAFIREKRTPKEKEYHRGTHLAE